MLNKAVISTMFPNPLHNRPKRCGWGRYSYTMVYSIAALLKSLFQLLRSNSERFQLAIFVVQLFTYQCINLTVHSLVDSRPLDCDINRFQLLNYCSSTTCLLITIYLNVSQPISATKLLLFLSHRKSFQLEFTFKTHYIALKLDKRARLSISVCLCSIIHAQNNSVLDTGADKLNDK